MTEEPGVSLFCSYAHQDSDLLAELTAYLRLLEQSGIIRAWHDGRINAGDDWREEIAERLRTSEVVLLLVSVHFLTSEFIQKHELPMALDLQRRGLALVVPVLLRPTPLWRRSELARLEALPDGAKPVVLWDPRDAAYTDICERLSTAILARTQQELDRDTPRTEPRQVRRRVLDIGLASEVPVGRSTILAVMIRRSRSGGLRAIFQRNKGYRIEPHEVESSEPFPVRFRPLAGRIETASLVVEIESEDFTCSRPRKTLEIAPHGDSAVCVFMVQAVRRGPLALLVNVYADESLLCGWPVDTVGVDQPSGGPRVQSAAFSDETPTGASDLKAVSRMALRGRSWALALVVTVGLTFGAFLLQTRTQPESPGAPPAPPSASVNLEVFKGNCRLSVRTILAGNLHFTGTINPPGPVRVRAGDVAFLHCSTRPGTEAGPFYAWVEWRRGDQVVGSVRGRRSQDSLVWSGRLSPGEYRVEVEMMDERTGRRFRWADSYRVVRGRAG